jgi:ubiquinone/menaquinone biosynthesis C-methylase UbiE
VVALDNWSADYIVGNGPRLLVANAEAAGAADRVEVSTGDMRSLPFEDDAFDAVVSTYAIDHLSSEGITKALAEAARVLKPGGTFLLMVINGDGWLAFVFGPLAHMHGFRDVRDPWTSRLTDAGFEIVERGRLPGTAWFLVGKP